MDADSSGLDDLLHMAERLTADMDGNGELPRVQRNLQQIMESGQQLWSRTAQTVSKDTSDIKASILLGSKGYDLPRISQKFESLGAAKAFEAVEPIRETDIQSFLKNERESAILSVIEESKKATFSRADRLYWENLENEWEQEKQRILNALVGSSPDVMDVTLDSESTLADISMQTRSIMDSTEMLYAKEVSLYNEQAIQGGIKHHLPDKFYDVAKNFDDKNVLNLWEMVKFMTDIPVHPGKDVLAARCSAAVQSAFVSQARKYLEKKYHQFMQTVVYGNLQKAQLGGIPGTYYLVRSFLQIKMVALPPGLEDGLVDGLPVWPTVYYCIRCGDWEAAVNAAKHAGAVLYEVQNYLTEYKESADRRLSASSESQVRLQYRRSVRNSTDPYKRAVLCILGCCDVADNHLEVTTKTDDYLWLHLSQIRPDDGDDDDTSVQDRITLHQFQTQLVETYGESHFNAYQQPFLYFQVLFLTAQFEAAVAFLSHIEHLRTHAVHVAVALYEMNLLALPSSVHMPLLSKNSADKAPMQRLNFARLAMLYTRKFEATDPREALQYFYLLRELKGTRGENLFMACVSELVLETREFDMLLGKMERDGCRIPGAIDKFHGDTQRIIEMAAADSESKGMYEDAVNLYDLAKNQEKVLELLNRVLSRTVPQKRAAGSARDRLENMAVAIAERYRLHGCTVSKETLGTFHLLLDLVTFFNRLHANQLTDALDTIQRLKLLPFQTEEVEEKVNAFSLYAEEIKRNLPDVLLGTMHILFTRYKTKKTSTVAPHSPGLGSSFLGESESTEKDIAYLRKQARALIVFAGMIPYHMPGDTNARLVQMEVLMN